MSKKLNCNCVISQAGNYVRDDTVSSTIQIVSSAAAERQAYAAMRLWTSLERCAVNGDATEKQPLVQVSIIIQKGERESTNSTRFQFSKHYCFQAVIVASRSGWHTSKEVLKFHNPKKNSLVRKYHWWIRTSKL